jgi:small subunit ribosomal protein S15
MAKKQENVFQRHDKDTWSPEMQIWLLSEEIATLQAHVASNSKDYDAKRSLLKKVAKRRSLLRYLKNKDLDAYTKISKKIWLKV